MILCHRTPKILVKPKNDNQNFNENYKNSESKQKKTWAIPWKRFFLNVWASFEGPTIQRVFEREIWQRIEYFFLYTTYVKNSFRPRL